MGLSKRFPRWLCPADARHACLIWLGVWWLTMCLAVSLWGRVHEQPAVKSLVHCPVQSAPSSLHAGPGSHDVSLATCLPLDGGDDGRVWRRYDMAVVTLVASTGVGYAAGAQKLLRGMRKWMQGDHGLDFLVLEVETKPIEPRVRRELQSCGWQVCRVPRLAPNLVELGQYADTFAKLYAWNLTEYRRVFLMDADLLVVGDVQWLRDVPIAHLSVAAVHDYAHGRVMDRFNSGLLVLLPDTDWFHHLVRQMDSPSVQHSFGDQGFLNQMHPNYTALPMEYAVNLDLFCRDYGHWRALVPNMRVIHFTVGKPWDPIVNNIYVVSVRRWWYGEHKDSAPSWLDCLVRLRPLVMWLGAVRDRLWGRP